MLKEVIKKDEIAAMKARDKARVNVLRMVNSEVKAYEVNNWKEYKANKGSFRLRWKGKWWRKNYRREVCVRSINSIFT